MTVECSSKYDPETLPEDPLDKPLEVDWDFTDAREKYFYDRSDTPKPVLTSAGETFEELLERDTGSLVATITRNIDGNAYDPAVAIDYKDAVNSTAFKLEGKQIAVGQAKLKAYTASAKKTENQITYRVARWVIEFRKSWDDVIEDRGLREKKTVAGKVILAPIMHLQPPVPVEKPWPLDGAGVKKTNASDTPSTLTFKPYFRKSFTRFKFV